MTKVEKKLVVWSLSVGAILMISFNNCSSNVKFQSTLGSTGSSGGLNPPPEEPPITPPVCDPFGGPGNTAGNGLKASIYSWDTANYPLSGSEKDYAMNYPDMGILITNNAFFSALNVSPRQWTTGFSTPDGLLQDQHGDPLVEWFGIDFRTKIRLDISTSESAGYYQLATLSDDGSVIWGDLNGNNNLVKVVDNDRTHSVQFRCAATAQYYNSATELPARIVYYQGPRNHIAMVALWKKVESATPPTDADCNLAASTSYFFAYNSSTNLFEPTQHWFDLIAANRPGGAWKVLTPGNYKLPDGVINQCL